MEFLIGLFVGLLFCYLFDWITDKNKRPSGTFIIDFRDPEKDVCKLELEESLDDIYEKREITLRVKTFDISHH